MNIRLIVNIFLVMTVGLVITFLSIFIGKQSYSWLPPQAAAESHLIDNLFSFLVTIGAFIFLGVTAAILYSVLFHRARIYDFTDGPHIEGNITLEIIWTAIPIMLVLWIATYSYQVYETIGIQGPGHLLHLHNPLPIQLSLGKKEQEPTATSLDKPLEKIDVIAKQWAWIFSYPQQGITSTELHLPSNQRVHLALQSEDVLHGFYIPAFRVKQDIVPGKTIDFEFTPTLIGKYSLTDSQYSGTYFATMEAKVIVQSPEDYDNWLKKAASQSPIAAPNQATTEYAQTHNKNIQLGWKTVAPAAPPVVNFVGDGHL
ncbi:MAG: cytochrome c oxidase subunit II [Cylindrospermopsis raciborskii KL1]|jgi:cytochrome c oxidase subunit 2|uniref:cytochrome c oxidase subunit II n=1 Tax=Cylindrospermopsis raciborskii TaxID=77022 RepID=UPI001A216190|nr:cytochrome c oxidase subunit II [Cylindrospermopsis raciborskii]MBG0743350.1 cytochrome c oxidase subunit II [Cylindrospermopsis raciborskii KL1]